MEHQSRTVEQKIARIASRANGIVTREELLAAGISRGEIRGRREKGLLITQYPGVYRVGHVAPSVEAWYSASVKACGEGAVLSGLAAAYLLGIVKGRPPPPEVTAPRERDIDGLLTRRSRRLDPRQVTTVRDIPVTTVARTIVDLAPRMGLGKLARVCHEAGVKYRTTPRQVEAVLGRNAPGSRRLREVMYGDVHVSLSALEQRFLELLREAGLPLPVTNKVASGRRVDCRWPEQGLTVELNSYTYHSSRHAWELDYRRQREARARDDDFRSYTWADVFEDPAPMLAELRKALSPAWPRA
jgi:hypothetical protein